MSGSSLKFSEPLPLSEAIACFDSEHVGCRGGISEESFLHRNFRAELFPHSRRIDIRARLGGFVFWGRLCHARSFAFIVAGIDDPGFLRGFLTAGIADAGDKGGRRTGRSCPTAVA